MADTFEGWTILELMGHRRLAGHLSEQEIAGASFLRLDIPGDPGVTQYYSPSAVYCITPTTEDVARAVARGSQPAPVQRWELPAPDRDDDYTSRTLYDASEEPEQYDLDDEDLDDVPGRPVDDVPGGGRL